MGDEDLLEYLKKQMGEQAFAGLRRSLRWVGAVRLRWGFWRLDDEWSSSALLTTCLGEGNPHWCAESFAMGEFEV